MKGTPKISVIIPSRDYGLFLPESIESVLNQTIIPEEIIVIDDGSVDDTEKIVKKYSPAVKYFFLKKRGVGAARNYGISLSSGKFISHLDADDVWVPEKLEIQLEEFGREPGLEIIGGMMQPFFDSRMSPERRKQIYCSDKPLPGFSASVILIKRESFQKVGSYRENVTIGQDLEWFIRAREIPLKEKMIKKTLALRRLHNSNSSMTNHDDRVNRLEMLKESLDRRRKKG